MSSSAGIYSMINLVPGNYVSKAGFSKERLAQMILGVNQAGSSNFTLSPGDVNQEVTVSAESSTVESTTSCNRAA